MQQNTAGAIPDFDLRKHPPRAATEKLGGILFLPRTIDKARAKLAGTLGPYKITPGISGYIFEWLDITEDAFVEAVRNAKSDDDVVAWVHANTDPAKYDGLNDMLINRGIRDAEHRAQVLPAYPILEDKPDLSNWFKIFALDDVWMYAPENLGKPGAAPKL